MTKRDWFEVWRDFAVWYKKMVKDGKPPGWRKQQRMIHKLVDAKVNKPETPIVRRGPGRPRKNPLPVPATPGAANNKETPSIPVAVTPGAHSN